MLFIELFFQGAVGGGGVSCSQEEGGTSSADFSPRGAHRVSVLPASPPCRLPSPFKHKHPHLRTLLLLLLLPPRWQPPSLHLRDEASPGLDLLQTDGLLISDQGLGVPEEDVDLWPLPVQMPLKHVRLNLGLGSATPARREEDSSGPYVGCLFIYFLNK